MDPTISELRTRFECETDIKIDPSIEDWKAYALWLESGVVDKLNQEAIAENQKLRDAFYQVTDILDRAVTEPIIVT